MNTNTGEYEHHTVTFMYFNEEFFSENSQHVTHINIGIEQ